MSEDLRSFEILKFSRKFLDVPWPKLNSNQKERNIHHNSLPVVCGVPVSRSEVNTGAFCSSPSYSFKDSDLCEFLCDWIHNCGVKRGLDPWSWTWAAQLSMWVLGRKPLSSGGAARALNLWAFSLASLHFSFWENASHWTGTHCLPAPKTELSWLPASSTRLKTHTTKLYKGARDWILVFMLVQKKVINWVTSPAPNFSVILR